jgi:ribonuclease HI
MFTDGATVPTNPGPGGFGVIWRTVGADSWTSLSGSYRRTTNNRMELLAAIAGLEALDRPSRVRIYSDSEYLVKAISRGWIRKWEKNDWARMKTGAPVKNSDLWKRLKLQFCRHDVEATWVRGHSGHPENEQADRTANEAAARPEKLADGEYERMEKLKLLSRESR